MRLAIAARLACVLLLCGATACSSKRVDDADHSGDTDETLQGKTLDLEIGPDSRAFVDLHGVKAVDLAGDGHDTVAWDLAFQGRDVFTNGGISGPGNAQAFGPLSAPTFLSDSAPEVPLLLEDRAGGALLNWYDYVGSTHQLFSRYHVYGIKDGERYYKLQVLGYYGEKLGAPVAALYHVRYAEVTADGVLKTHEVSDLDAVAGGSKTNDDVPASCLELDSENVTSRTPAQAAEKQDWQLCFRREAVALNGGLSGPRGVQAVDLQAEAIANESEDEVKERTAASEQKRFDDVDFATLSDPKLDYREDGVVTAFGRRWLEPDSEPLAVSDAVWLVRGVSLESYLVRFSELSADPATERASLRLEAKLVR